MTFSDTSAKESYIYAKKMLGKEEAKKVGAEALIDKDRYENCPYDETANGKIDFLKN